MTIFVIECAPERLRGILTRWMLEIRPGVFAGKISTMVRDALWSKVVEERPELSAIRIYDYAGEQGFHMDMTGDPKRRVIDLDGLQLIEMTN